MMREYQQRAVDFGKKVETPFFAIDMGLGKTLIALTIIAQSGQPAMVLGPLNTILHTWPAEIEKWYPHLTYRVMHGKTRTTEGINKIDILLMNYEGLAWFAKQSCTWVQRHIIFDESSMVKAHDTQRFRLLKQMRQLWHTYKMCLSATPAPNSLSELWSQYYLLDQGKRLGKNITSFRSSYCRPIRFPGRAFTIYEVLEEAKEQIAAAVSDITFRLEAKDYIELPELITNAIYCELPTKVMKQYRQFENTLALEVQGTTIVSTSAAATSGKLRQLVQGGLYDENRQWHVIHTEKVKALKELVAVSSGKSILCAIQFRGELNMLRKEFGNIPVVAGGIPRSEVNKHIKNWIAGKIPLLLCHPAALSHGLNLQSGGYIIVWYGLTWSLEQYQQLIGRLYRSGQENRVIVHHILAKGTIDEQVSKALKNKSSVQQWLLDYFKRGQL